MRKKVRTYRVKDTLSLLKIFADMNERAVCGLPLSVVERIIAECVRISGIAVSAKELHVSVSTVSLEEMQKLNGRYRKKDALTDVLSFSHYPDRASIEKENGEMLILGDVMVSCDVVQRQAVEDGVRIERECAYLVAHGVLHLLGYDHEPEQFSIQDEICAILFTEYLI